MSGQASDALDEAHAAATALLMLYEHLGITATLLVMDGQTLTVMCQNAGDVLPMCNRVIGEHYMPPGRTKH